MTSCFGLHTGGTAGLFENQCRVNHPYMPNVAVKQRFSWRVPELDWAKMALWFLYNVFTDSPQAFVPDGSLVTVAPAAEATNALWPYIAHEFICLLPPQSSYQLQ